MNVYINNERKEIQNQNSILELLSDLSLNGTRGIAVAVNNIVIPKNSWEVCNLNENDRVTIIKATQGG